jgi:hypothetical protein
LALQLLNNVSSKAELDASPEMTPMRHSTRPLLGFLIALGCSSAKPGSVIPPFEHDASPDVATDAGDETADAPPDSPDTGDASTDEQCVSECSSAGAFRCAGMSQVQVCTERSTCLRWVEVGTCGANQICCDGVCSVIDTANCYACGRTCAGAFPACSPTLKTCSCSEASCRANGQTCNVATGLCVRAAVYVDQATLAGGDGSPAAPFQAITAALESIRTGKSTDRLVLVASGVYDRQHGEQFPLVLRGGVSLEGAGTAATKIQGAGRYPVGANGSPVSLLPSASPTVTMVAGDTTAVTTISRLSILAPDPMADIGLFCDRGNMTESKTDGAANTQLDQVVIRSFYDNGLFVTTSMLPERSGCNIRMTRSSISNSHWGIHAVGCEGFDHGAPVPNPVYVGIDLGDGTMEGGNSFVQMTYSLGGSPDGAVMVLRECVDHVRSRYDVYRDSDAGIYNWQPAHGGQMTCKLTFEHDTFEALKVYGLWFQGGALEFTSITDNVFRGIGSAYDFGYPCAAVLLDVGDDPAPYFPHGKWRRNQFIGNDAAVYFRKGLVDLTAATRITDFGTATDPGGNVFACNSSPTGKINGDIVVDAVASGVALPFEGNAWDHVPPTRATRSSAANGTDLLIPDMLAPNPNTTGATEAGITCPAGRVR